MIMMVPEVTDVRPESGGVKGMDVSCYTSRPTTAHDLQVHKGGG